MTDLFSSVLWYSLGLLLTLLFSRIFYLIYLHPLSRYPGPVMAKLTDAYGAYSAYQRRLHLDTLQNLRKHGNIIRQGPNKLVFNTARAAEDIYLNTRVVKSASYIGARMGHPRQNLINILNRDHHRRKRRLVSPVLSDRFLKGFEPVMSNQVDIFLQKIHQSSIAADKVDMSPATQHLTSDIVGHLAFGIPWEMQTEATYHYLNKTFDDMSSRVCLYMQWTALVPLEKLFIVVNLSAMKAFQKALGYVIQTRMALGRDARNDLYSAVRGNSIEQEYENDSIVDGDLWSEAGNFMVAGCGPSSAALSAVFFYLSRNSDCYEKIVAEVRNTFIASSEICIGPKLSSCCYLRACINESMRMSPPSMSFPWRVQDPDDKSGLPWIVDGHIIPRGTEVAVHDYPLFHNEEIFSNSFRFNPERWLRLADGGDASLDNEARERMKKAFIPFSIGERSCPAKTLSLMEISLTLARTLWHFDFEKAPGLVGELGGGTAGRTDGRGRVDEYQLDDVFYSAHKGPNLVFKQREEFTEHLKAQIAVSEFL